MHGLNLLAVKAAALRKAATEFDVNSGIGIRAGDFGTGVPPQIPRDMAPLTAADHAALAAQPPAAHKYPGKPTVPMMGRSGKGSVLLRMMKSRGGKAGLGVGAAGGVGYGLFGGTMEPEAAPEVPAGESAPPEASHPRMRARQSVAGKAGRAIGSWWDKMSDKYNLGSRGQR